MASERNWCSPPRTIRSEKGQCVISVASLRKGMAVSGGGFSVPFHLFLSKSVPFKAKSMKSDTPSRKEFVECISRRLKGLIMRF